MNSPQGALAAEILLRLVRLAATLGIVALVVFLVLRVLPGDSAQQIVGLHASAEDVARLQHELGTDRPLSTQFVAWLGELVTGNWGKSLVSGQPVSELLAARLPVTLGLAFWSLVVGLGISLPLGVVAAVKRGSWVDRIILFASQFGLAIPGFWLGILLLLGFAVALPLFPLFGSSTPWHFVLPTTALAVGMAAVLVRHLRASLLEELSKDYVRGARAGGLSESRVIGLHALPNALMPVLTVAGIQFGYLLGGAVIVEQVFSLPGVGRLLLTAVLQRDLPVIQAGVVLLALAFCLTSFLVDLLQAWANPRLRRRS